MRDLLRAIQAKLRVGNISPSDTREHATTLSALLGNCLAEVLHAEMAYNAVLLTKLDVDEAANRATIRALNTEEYRRFREAKNTEKLALEMMRTCNRCLRSLDNEMALTR